MRKLTTLLLGMGLAASPCLVSAQANVEVTWKDPKSYTDIRPANESRKRFRERTFSDLEGYIVELAESLPEGQKLEIVVTDLDLAGQVWPAQFIGGVGANDVRLVRRIDIPRMSFSYKLLAEDESVLQEKDVELKDMAFQERFNPIFNSRRLRYEKNMLRDWFADEFPQLTAKNDE